MGLIRKWKRARLARREFPANWIPILERYLAFYPHLPDKLRLRFHELLKVFAWEKQFIGASGLSITDDIRVVISGLAVRLVLYLDLSYYDRLTEIVVYPHHYKHKEEYGVLLGEAQSRFGTVVLSWPAVLEGLRFPCDGHETATHEFAHVLDRASGGFTGTPPLRASEHYRVWAKVMSKHYLDLQKGNPRQLMVLREYGAKNEAEFFAVATESFFEKPLAMRQLTPDLYGELRRFYGFDPAEDPTCGARTLPPQG